MKIAWFHSHLLHVNSGGTRFVIDYCTELKEKFGHQISLFCDASSRESEDLLRQNGIEVIPLDRSSTNSLWHWLSLPYRLWAKRRRLADQIGKYDLLISSMFPMNLLIRKFDKPKLQVCYEPFAFFYDKGFLKNFSFSERLFFFIASLVFSKADMQATREAQELVTIAQTNVRKIEKVYSRTPEVVYAGIDTDRYKRAAPEQIGTILEKHSGRPLLFHSTDLTGIKGTFPLLDLLRELTASFPDIKLLLTVYVNNPQAIEKLRQVISESELNNHVEYLGCLERHELPLYYSSVDFVCQPSLNQPANWPLKESLLCGTPIIGGAQSEEAVDMVNGIRIDINNKKEALEKLLLVLNSKNQLLIDNTELIRDFSKNSCVAKFNSLILKTYENYKYIAG